MLSPLSQKYEHLFRDPALGERVYHCGFHEYVVKCIYFVNW
uniref:Uncharacterized protein n=1 Tax=Anguilla anguilla TaxID=7936 RepID=A0A0E9PNF5_ANGAN